MNCDTAFDLLVFVKSSKKLIRSFPEMPVNLIYGIIWILGILCTENDGDKEVLLALDLFDGKCSHI